MKIQDISLGIVLMALLVLRKPRLLAAVGLGCLILAMPLFYWHVFFTAERLTWYAAGLFLIDIILFVVKELKGQ